MDDDIRARIRAKRDQQRELGSGYSAVGSELTELVREAFAFGLTWQQIAEDLGGVSRARVYQIRGPKDQT